MATVAWLAAGWALHPIWHGALHLQGEGSRLGPEWCVVVRISFDLPVAAYTGLHRHAL